MYTNIVFDSNLPTDSGESTSHVVRQAVYIKDENDSDLYIKTLEYPGVTKEIDRVLMTVAILKQGGYISTAGGLQTQNQTNSYDSIFFYYLAGSFMIKNHDDLSSSWNRSKSGHWSYIVT